MRITGGLWASRRVSGPPKGLRLRPAPDFLRAQAFAVLADEVEGACFLDLFAGSGVVSLEALSRGAREALLVEPHPAAREVIARNCKLFGLGPPRVCLWAVEAETALRRLAASAAKVDLVWADPPFHQFQHHLPCLQLLVTGEVLRRGGALVLECPPKREVELPGFLLQRRLRGALLFRRAG